MYNLTRKGREKVQAFLAECQAKRKELLGEEKDTAVSDAARRVASEWDIIGDINWRGLREDGSYEARFMITDHRYMTLYLKHGEDICGDEPADMFK